VTAIERELEVRWFRILVSFQFCVFLYYYEFSDSTGDFDVTVLRHVGDVQSPPASSSTVRLHPMLIDDHFCSCRNVSVAV